MPTVYAIASNIISGLGMDTADHWSAAETGRISIQQYTDPLLSTNPFMASRLSPEQSDVIRSSTGKGSQLSPFEQLAVYSVRKACEQLDYPLDIAETAFVLSTTKGNIELLGRTRDEQILLHYPANRIAAYIGIPTRPMVVSLACASGVVALQHGLRLLRSGRYKHAVVTGCDRFSRFVLNGFQSFQAISDEPCRPFDAERKGISLGEGAATIILSVNRPRYVKGILLSGATTNDANHISGPSRTGDELATAISNTLKGANISSSDISMISAHGTATLFNDEMEARAFGTAGLANCPVHSFKGYVGHTLGAAGILESVMALESIKHQKIISSAGFATPGVPVALNVTRTTEPAEINYVLKTASGFGGCNAAIVWQRPGTISA